MSMIPEHSTDPLYLLLSNEDIAGFNAKCNELDTASLRGKHYRGLDLRGMNADGLDLSDSYFRSADLRGIDFRTTRLEGSTLTGANISGCFFPYELSAEEIRLSVEMGTRLRYRR
jgi:uncharacterized protein YjbI with pentapeptide repeats